MISSEKQRFHVLYLNLNYTADINDLCIIAILKKEILKSASNLNGNLNCSKELEHYAS